jgi:ABC-2 type transport system permease protein
MSGNSAFKLVSEVGWYRGFGNMFSSELARWWKTRMWWVQSLIWVMISGILLSLILFTSSTRPSSDEVAVLFALFIGLFPSIGVIIIMQSAVVGEKRDGTAAWVFSKPLTRPAYILSKVIGNCLGVIGTMVIIPGIFSYILCAIATGDPWNPVRFLAALCVIFLSHLFFLSLTVMLGTLFQSRGPVIGISLGLWLMQQNLIGLWPVLGFVLPWKLIIPNGSQMDAVAPAILIGLHGYSTTLILVIILECILFILIGIYRLSREEF